ncbi:MAG: hypothetical protein ABJB11_10815 [Ferruginibacter sp.]
MTKIKRDAFLKMGALVLLAPFSNNFLAQAAVGHSSKHILSNNELMQRLLIANDKQVADLIKNIGPDEIKFARKIGYDFANLSASYCYPDSAYYHSPLVVSKLEILLEVLERFQTADGTVNIGNLESPPDTAFLIEILSAATYLLIKDNSPEIRKINDGIKGFMLRAGDALTTGGVHTPNHRWVVSAALAGINKIYPNKKYVARIDDWLGEGVYMDSDGHYPERSGIYSGVETNAFITIGRLLNRPALYESVRKNLTMTYYYIEPNGEMVTNDSRRQDQYAPKSVMNFYLQYRFMAIHDKNPTFAAVASFIESLPEFEEAVLATGLFHFMEDPLLQQSLPSHDALTNNYEKLFTTSSLLRIRKGSTSATLFGGADWPITIASGRSNSPNFFAYRKVNAVLKYARLSTAFFSMGYFYSEGIRKNGTKYILHKKLEIPYYQPLPKNLRNSKGDYKLSPSVDGRFWNKMDFKNRPVSNVKTQDTTITFSESNGAVELNFSVTGLPGVAVTIELCFEQGGKLSGVSTEKDGSQFLENGYGKYEMDGDTIEFGPGTVADKSVANLEGEKYSSHFGSLKTKGEYVYLTGITPFTHTLKFS